MAETARNIVSSFLNGIQFDTHFNMVSSQVAVFSTQFNAIRFINSFNQTIALTIPVLANFLQLKKTDPFSTHPKTMRVAVSTTILFYLAYTALLRFPLRRRAAIIADHCLLAIGNASVASLASVLLSPFVFAVFGLLFAAELLHWLYAEFIKQNNDDDDDDVLDGRRMRVSALFDNIWSAFSNVIGQPQPILPV